MTDEIGQAGDADRVDFDAVRREVSEGGEPSRSVRDLLRWFGARRRGAGVVERIEAELIAAGLRTDPHFSTTWIDAQVVFKRHDPTAAPSGGGDVADAIHLVRMLEAANREVVCVNPEDPIAKAITLMLAHDFSQLAVMTSPRELKGVISWKTIGSRLSQRSELRQVRDAMEEAAEVYDAASLLDVTKKIIDCDYVFVRALADRKVIGIVTATDVSEQFLRLSEPFLLLGRIEHRLRRVIQDVFEVETLRAACDDQNFERRASITKASQLTFGEYCRIFGNKENWEKLHFFACRKTFCALLEEVRKQRNEIMHFHPDAVEGTDFEPLRRFLRLLEKLDRLAD